MAPVVIALNTTTLNSYLLRFAQGCRCLRLPGKGGE